MNEDSNVEQEAVGRKGDERNEDNTKNNCGLNMKERKV